jgi:protein LTV1
LKIGLLNQAAPAPGPHPEMDPDIVAILDDDEGQMDFDELDDDFVAQANARAPGDEDDERDDDERSEEMEDEEDDREMGSDFGDEHRWNKEETRSRFTEYSMSSSVIPRTDGLQQLDARFEKIYEQYDDSEVGSLDGEEEESVDSDDENGLIDLNSDRMLEMADEFAAEQKQKRVTLDQLGKFTDDRRFEETEDQEPLERVYVSEEQDRFDCETIVSTYSNLYNHPTLIKEEKKVRLDKKTGLPVDALRGSGGLTKNKLNQLPDDEKIGTASVRSTVLSVRPKDETAEEKRLRKQTVKLERKERRCEKKANQMAFKDEEIRRKAVDLNLRQNLQGMKLS